MHGETAKRRDEKPREPDAFAFPLDTDAVHPVVPITGANERQPMVADGAGAVDRSRTMLVQGPRLRAHRRQIVDLLFVIVERAHLEVWRARVQHAAVAGDANVM